MPSQSDFDSDKQLVSELQRILHSCVNGLHTSIATLKKTALSSEQHQAIDKLEYDTDHLHTILPLLLNSLNGNEALYQTQAHSQYSHSTDNGTPMQAEDELETTKEIFGAGFAELVQLFLEDSPPRLIALHDAAVVDDCSALAQNAHTLCGSTSSIGATSLAAMCGELEIRARNNISSDASVRIDAIAREYERIKKKLLLMA